MRSVYLWVDRGSRSPPVQSPEVHALPAGYATGMSQVATPCVILEDATDICLSLSATAPLKRPHGLLVTHHSWAVCGLSRILSRITHKRLMLSMTLLPSTFSSTCGLSLLHWVRRCAWVHVPRFPSSKRPWCPAGLEEFVNLRSSHSKFKLVWHQFSTVQFPRPWFV